MYFFNLVTNVTIGLTSIRVKFSIPETLEEFYFVQMEFSIGGPVVHCGVPLLLTMGFS